LYIGLVKFQRRAVRPIGPMGTYKCSAVHGGGAARQLLTKQKRETKYNRFPACMLATTVTK
jgi:hypothetical protein